MGKEGFNKFIVLGAQQDSAGVTQQFIPMPINSLGELIVSPGAYVDIAVLASAARTVETNSATISARNHRGILIFVDITAQTDDLTQLSINIIAIGPTTATESFYLGAQLFNTGAGTQIMLSTYPGHEVALEPGVISFGRTLPNDFQIQISPSDANSVTYSVNATLIP